MIPVTSFKGKTAFVFGLGGSGLATAEALKAGEAKVVCFDDNAQRCDAALEAGLLVQDLRELDFSGADALILAPGVPLTHPEPHWSVKLAEAASVPVIGDVELFARERRIKAPKSTFIAITGTNGKSTTTALISHILSSNGLNVQMGGNIGQAVLTLDPLRDDAFYVVECSSYQIDLAPSLDPTIGIHLNLSPDHIDRHGTFDHYAEVKARLPLKSQHAIVGIDDEASLNIAERVRAAKIPVETVALDNNRASDIQATNDAVLINGIPVANIQGIPSLRGQHNLQNAAVAYAACRKAGLSEDAIQAGLNSFPGLPHRMEQVLEKEGLLFINDSKATNADAAARALASFDEILWIAGGVPKEGGISSLNSFFPKIVHAFLIGEAAREFGETLSDKVPSTLSMTLDKAVEDAILTAATLEPVKAGRTRAVVFSPACASFDQFANFEVRGDAFKSAVRSIL